MSRVYAIVDGANFTSLSPLRHFVSELLAGGVTWIQYRNKSGSSRDILSCSREIRRIAGNTAVLIMNDRPDLCMAADFDGVHLGQEDLEVESARQILGPKKVIGISTHNPEQLAAASATSADYIAIGPVFATLSKLNPDPVIGLDFVRSAREKTTKPLVAIGGITRENCRSVIDSGAHSVAVIRELLESPRASAQELLRRLA
jgi:thiamine-phosphate pyrophosphorylase